MQKIMANLISSLLPGLLLAGACGSNQSPPGPGNPPGSHVLAFGAQTPLPQVGGGTITSADVNGDGKLDLVLADSGSMGTQGFALLGNGSGGFMQAAVFSTGGSATWIATGDTNGDGKLDLVVSMEGSSPIGDMEVNFGNGDGTFRVPSGFNAELHPLTDVLGDFNGDGKADAAVVDDNGQGFVTVLLFGGTGHTNYAVNKVPHALAVADFNHDGKLDLAAGGGDPTFAWVQVLLGKGDGTFTVGQPMTLEREVSALGVGDFDGDGKLDLAAGTGGGTVHIGRGVGDGTFAFGPALPALNDFGGVIALQVGDFDGDTRLDVANLVVPGAGPAFLSVLLGDGQGGMGAPTHTFGTFDTGGVNLGSLTSGDYAHSGRPDLVVAHGPVDRFVNQSK